MTRGIFVTHSGCIAKPRGGVQICTQEYIDVIAAAGIDLRICALDLDRRFSTRFIRRFVLSSPYFRPAEPAAIDRVASLASEVRPDFLFLNQVNVAVLAPQLRKRIPGNYRIVALSHGLESTDLLHQIRLRRQLPLNGRVKPIPSLSLGHAILTENSLRSHIDVVCTLSPFDTELEYWIGASRVDWLPRIVERNALRWRPSGDRLGFVGTLDHAPNLEGLIAVLDQFKGLAAGHLRARVVGGPASIGQWLSQSYQHVDYLGQLDEAALEAEASTWNAFLHPIFCNARGCSTKLATAMSWQIPIVTTTRGRRGYEWGAGELVIADDPLRFARECMRLLAKDAATEAQAQVARVAGTSPTVETNAQRLRGMLGL